MTRRPIAHHLLRGARRQDGVYAIEFAFVFLIFFSLVYAALCYGIFFTLRFGLQNAAEDGARAALRHQVNLQAREAKAEAVTRQQTSGWLPVALGSNDVVTKICEVESKNCTGLRCGTEWSQRCQIEVTITVRGMNKLLPLLNFAMPDTMVGQASMLLDSRGL